MASLMDKYIHENYLNDWMGMTGKKWKIWGTTLENIGHLRETMPDMMMDEGLQILNLRIRGPIWGMTYTDLWMTVPRIAGFESILSTINNLVFQWWVWCSQNATWGYPQCSKLTSCWKQNGDPLTSRWNGGPNHQRPEHEAKVEQKIKVSRDSSPWF